MVGRYTLTAKHPGTTRYVPGTNVELAFRTTGFDWKYRGLLVDAVNAANETVGSFSFADASNRLFWEPPRCPGALAHTSADAKPFGVTLTYTAPPAGTATSTSFWAISPRFSGPPDPHTCRMRFPRFSGPPNPHTCRMRFPRFLGPPNPHTCRMRFPRFSGPPNPHTCRMRFPRFLGQPNPHTCRMRRSTWYLCCSGADWCLESDVVTNLGLQALAASGSGLW